MIRARPWRCEEHRGRHTRTLRGNHAMRILRLIVILAVTLGMPGPTSAAQTACGTERWDVKTLTDAAASSVDLTPRLATVEQLTALPVPGPLALHTPRYPDEMRTYRVSGHLIGFKLETDSDIHIVIAGTSGATMIVEIPDPGCVGTLKQAEMRAAREGFVRTFGPPTRQFTRPAGSPSLTVTGVLFFDIKHGQTGVAQNGVELHPVLKVK